MPFSNCGEWRPLPRKPDGSFDLTGLAFGPAAPEPPGPKPDRSALAAARKIMANTTDVGSQFAEEARKMHYGESEERNIRGQASIEETKDLLEEGIEVLPLPVPDALKGGLQ